MKRICPNCRTITEIDEFHNHCIKCGFIWIDMIEKMSDEEVEERTHTRRTGDGVDQIDG